MKWTWRQTAKILQTKIDNLNRAISMKETESIINSFPKKMTWDPDGFSCEFYQFSTVSSYK